MTEPKHAAPRKASDISPKVTAATVAAAVTTIGVYIVETLVPGLDIPSLVEGAITTVLVFAGGYIVRD